MAGIYLHIPFCKSRCIYCDFYSTTHSEWKERYVQALCKELEMRREYLNGEQVETIYWGGGTPSLLDEKDFKQVFATIEKHFGMEHCQEITLEANPDDLSPIYLQMLSQLPFNRISIGIQTFHDDTLQLLKRRHHAQTAIDAVHRCRKAGFRNISIDLIYGLPEETKAHWEDDLRQAIGLDVEHISAYHLTYEEGTPIHKMLKRHQIREVSEETSVEFFMLLTEHMQKAGYEHYEISNFCREGNYSRHNTSYWKGIPYLGCGASAHSFNGTTREWNIASVDLYIIGIEANQRNYETEFLDHTTRYNEFIITTLRTMWGTPIEKLKQQFGAGMWEYCRKMASPYIKNHKLEELNGALRLTKEGIFISDSIISDLLFVNK